MSSVFNIGITINFDKDFYSNGLQQNVVFLNNLFNQLENIKSFYIYEGKELDSFFINKSLCFPYVDILKNDAIKFDLIIMMGFTFDEIVIKKLEQVQEELSKANSSLSGQIAHSAESMIQQLKTNSRIKELVTSLHNENQLHFLFGEMASECVDTFTKRTLKEGDFTYINVKRKVLMLCQNLIDHAQVQYSAWETPKKIDPL